MKTTPVAYANSDDAPVVECGRSHQVPLVVLQTPVIAAPNALGSYTANVPNLRPHR
jgi:hypothetical protein